MTILIPQNFDLLSSSVSDTEQGYPDFVYGAAYTAGDGVNYNRYLYTYLGTTLPSAAAWDSTTVYYLNDRVSYGSVNYVFLNAYFQNPAPAADGRYTLMASSIAEWSSTTTYAVGDFVLYQGECYIALDISTNKKPPNFAALWERVNMWAASIFYVSGDYVYNPLVNSAYQANANIVAYDPTVDTTNWAQEGRPSDPNYWEEAGPANSLRMFDASNTTQTTDPNGIILSVQALNIDALYFGSLDADAITIKVYATADDSLLETATVDLAYSAVDFPDYFPSSWTAINKNKHVYWRTTTTQDVYFNISITNSAGTVGCGILIMGSRRYIGSTLWGPRVGGTDYTAVTQDPNTGGSTATDGVYLPVVDLDCSIRTSASAIVTDLLFGVKGSPAAFIGDETDVYQAVNMFGILSSFNNVLSGPTTSTVSLEVTALY